MRILALVMLCVLHVSCTFHDEVVETGYRGKARTNAWLAAERFAEDFGYETRTISTLELPDEEAAVWFTPASAVSNMGFVDRFDDWVRDGGHLVLMLDHANGFTSDWPEPSGRTSATDACKELLERAEMIYLDQSGVAAGAVTLEGEEFKVSMEPGSGVKVAGGEAQAFASVPHGEGRLTVVSDARVFRNRWIGQHEHAALLLAVLDVSPYEGEVVFVRSAAVSLGMLLWDRLWPVLLGLGVVIVLWLWRNLRRFGPIEPAVPPPVLRGYEHHLEALGGFGWRLDKAQSLLAPLRERIVEHGQRLTERAGTADFFEILAVRSGIPRDRVYRALAEPAPADMGVLVQTSADLQKLLQSLQ